MDLTNKVVDFLTAQGATSVQVKIGDSNTEYEKQNRITFVFVGRTYEMNVGLVRQHGVVSK
jgi:hypothetical protein